MIKNKWTLSNNAHFTAYDDKDRNVYFEEDVKEFIRLLKEKIKNKPYVDDCIPKEAIILWIDKFSGGKLK